MFAPENSSKLFDQSEATSPVGYRPPVGTTSGYKHPPSENFRVYRAARIGHTADSELNKSGVLFWL